MAEGTGLSSLPAIYNVTKSINTFGLNGLALFEPVRGSTELLTSLRHLPSCWTSEAFYGTTCAPGGFPTNIRCFLLHHIIFPSHAEGAFFCVFPGSEVPPWCLCQKPPALNLISLRTSSDFFVGRLRLCPKVG